MLGMGLLANDACLQLQGEMEAPELHLQDDLCWN